MKKLIISMVLLFGLSAALAQELPLYNQYLMNGFLLNPALAGSNDYIPMRLSDRHQWVGMKGAPQTQVFTAHAHIKDNGMGLCIFNDMNGNVSMSGIQLTYSYHIVFRKYKRIRRRSGKIYKNRPRLSFGVSLNAMQFNIDQRGFVTEFQNDPAISGARETTNMPDASFGVYYFNRNNYIGLSAIHLFESRINLYDRDLEQNNLQRQYFLHIGRKNVINDEYAFEPSVMIKMNEKMHVQTDFNLKFLYREEYWFAISYRRHGNTPLRRDNSIKFLAGFRFLKRFHAAYAYDYIFSDLHTYSFGTHELMLGYNLGQKIYD